MLAVFWILSGPAEFIIIVRSVVFRGPGGRPVYYFYVVNNYEKQKKNKKKMFKKRNPYYLPIVYPINHYGFVKAVSRADMRPQITAVFFFFFILRFLFIFFELPQKKKQPVSCLTTAAKHNTYSISGE